MKKYFLSPENEENIINVVFPSAVENRNVLKKRNQHIALVTVNLEILLTWKHDFNFETGKRTSAQVINFGTLLFHGAEVNISIEFGAEVNIWWL